MTRRCCPSILLGGPSGGAHLLLPNTGWISPGVSKNKLFRPGFAFRSISILDVKKCYCRAQRLVGHSSTIRSLDWSSDGNHIMSMDQAYESLIFNVGKGKVSKSSHRDEQWITWTNVLGFPVMGIWPDYSDGTDINAAHRSPCGRYVLTCDDFGKVR